MDINVITSLRQIDEDSIYYPTTHRSDLDENSEQLIKNKIKGMDAFITKYYACFSQKTDKKVLPS